MDKKKKVCDPAFVAWQSSVGKIQVDVDAVLMQMISAEPSEEVGCAFVLSCQRLCKRAGGYLKALDLKLDPTKAWQTCLQQVTHITFSILRF